MLISCLARCVIAWKDATSPSLDQLFAKPAVYTSVSFPASSAATLTQIRHPLVPFQPGTLHARCQWTATTLTLGRRSPEREGEAFPLLHALIFRYAPAKLHVQQAQAACNQELFSHDGMIPINQVEAQPEVERCITTELPHSWQVAVSAAVSESLGECTALTDERGRCPSCTGRTDYF